MIVVLKQNPNRDQLESLIAWLQEKGIIIHTSIGEAHTEIIDAFPVTDIVSALISRLCKIGNLIPVITGLL